MSVSRKLRIGAAVSTAVVAMLVTPTLASAGPVEDLVNQVSNGVNQTLDGLLGGGANKPGNKPETQGGGGESGYVPPAHGTNPHGQGTVGIVDLNLFEEPPNPLPYDPTGGPFPDGEEIVVGQSRGEQNPDGTYHGHVTMLTLLGLVEVPAADTNEGETDGGLFSPLNDDLLFAVCGFTGGAICLEAADADSETDENGSENSFSAANLAAILPPELFGEDFGFFASAGSSEGEISEENGCQVARGESSVLTVEGPFGFIDAARSESESSACNDGTSTQENDSSVLVFEFDGEEYVVDEECADGVADTILFDEFFATLVCNADDSSNDGGTQMDPPYGVREAVNAFLIPFDILDGGESFSAPEPLGIIIDPVFLFESALAASESHAVAPPEEPPVCPDPTNPDCPVEPPVPPDGDGDGDPDQQVEEELTSSTDEGPGAPRGPSARTSDDLLPFTGADVGLLALVGAVVMATGLAGMALSDRRRRARGES